MPWLLAQAGHCGGNWEAMADSKQKYKGKYVTGRCIATCRHDVCLSMCNFIQHGERYAYYFYVLLALAKAGRLPSFMHIDVACKVGPYLHSCAPLVAMLMQDSTFKDLVTDSATGEALSFESVEFLVSEMHSKLHSWECQVTSWSLSRESRPEASRFTPLSHYVAFPPHR